MDQGDQRPVGVDQVVLRSGAGLPLPLGTTPLIQRRLASSQPRVCRGSANCSIRSPRCVRETPQKAGRVKAARAHFSVTLEEPVWPLSRQGRIATESVTGRAESQS